MTTIEEKKRNVPNVRFRGFEREWEEIKIGELGDVVTGSTPETSKQEFYGGEVPFFTPADIPDAGGEIGRTEKTLTAAGLSRVREVPRGATLFVCIGSTIGKVGQTTEVGASNQQINAVIANEENEPNFIHFLLVRAAPRIRELTAIQAVPIINKTTFSNERIRKPERAEQQKIATFLDAVDCKITHIQKKKALLEDYKKGCMQKLFSHELRFKDDDGNDFPDWEEQSVDDLFETVATRPFQILSSQVKNSGQHPVIDQGKSPILGYCNATDRLFTPPSHGVIVFGDHTTELKFIDFGFVVGADGVKILKAKESDPRYLFFALQFFNVVQEGYKRHFSILRRVRLPIPEIPEQQKIADFLSAIDTKIQLATTEIEQAQFFKKGLLQQMFV